MRPLAGLAVVAAIAPIAAGARADDDADVARRLDAVGAELEAGQARARAWQIGWGTGYWVIAVGEGALAIATDDREKRAQLAVGAAESALGSIAAFVFPWTAAHAADDLAAMDASTPAARRVKLARAERLLRDAAEQEDFEKSWLSHAGVALVNVAGGAVLWAGYDLKGPALVSVASGIAVGELQIWSAPTAARDGARAITVGAGAGTLVVRGSF